MLPIAHGLSSDFRILLLDIPGHGGSPLPEEAQAHQVLEALESRILEEDEPFWMLGYSLGARLAMRMAHEGRIRPEGLILLAGHPGLGAHERPARLSLDQKLMGEVHDQNSLVEFLRRWYAADLFKGVHELKDFEELLMARAQGNWRQWKRALDLYSLGRQEELTLPRRTLYLAGEEDQKYASLARTLGVQFKLIPSVSHALPWEAPQKVAQLALEFVKRHSAIL